MACEEKTEGSKHSTKEWAESDIRMIDRTSNQSTHDTKKHTRTQEHTYRNTNTQTHEGRERQSQAHKHALGIGHTFVEDEAAPVEVRKQRVAGPHHLKWRAKTYQFINLNQNAAEQEATVDVNQRQADTDRK